MSELPKFWCKGQIKDLLSIRNGYAFKSIDFNNFTGIPAIRQTNLNTAIVNFNKSKIKGKLQLILIAIKHGRSG